MIRQGEVYWVDLGEPLASEPGYLHPHLVVQNNLFNASRIGTVVVCALTSNLRRAGSPGNLLLRPEEANLIKRSVVNISQLFTVDKSRLGDRIGSLSPARFRTVLRGITLLLEPREPELAEELRD